MLRNFKIRFLPLATLLLCVLLVGVSTSPLWVPAVDAQEKKKKLTKAEKEAKLKYKNGITRKRKAVGMQCAKKLEKVQEFTLEEQWPDAEKELKAALKRGCKEGFEHSEVNRFLGYVYYAQEQYGEAIKAYLAFINEPEADAQKRVDTRYTVAQLMFVTEDYQSAAIKLEKCMAEALVVDRGGKVLLALIYYNLYRKTYALNIVEEVMQES
ncbi:MAG: hypothetical protein L7S59_05730, partial [Pseudomonadales bacterium]|nr:hypothetical protein [Pseudomonadales bacterium]